MTSADEAEVRRSMHELGRKHAASGAPMDRRYAEAGDVVVKTEYLAGYSSAEFPPAAALDNRATTGGPLAADQ